MNTNLYNRLILDVWHVFSNCICTQSNGIMAE